MLLNQLFMPLVCLLITVPGFPHQIGQYLLMRQFLANGLSANRAFISLVEIASCFAGPVINGNQLLFIDIFKCFGCNFSVVYRQLLGIIQLLLIQNILMHSVVLFNALFQCIDILLPLVYITLCSPDPFGNCCNSGPLVTQILQMQVIYLFL